MEKFIDIHCHILPGLDDGAGNLDETREMLKIACQEGVGEIIVTPHFFEDRKSADPNRIREAINTIQEQMDSWKIPITLHEGNEIFYRMEVSDELEAGNVCTMAKSRYVLVEFHPMMEYSYLRDGLLKLLSYNYYPIVAHPERYECLFRDKERLAYLKEQGIYFQVNASSFLGGLFQELTKRAKYMLKADLVDFIATDAHSSGRRSPRIRECASYIQKKAGKKRSREIFYEHPRAILNNQRI